MAKTLNRELNRNPSLRLRDIVAYLALAACTATGLLVIFMGERIHALFGMIP